MKAEERRPAWATGKGWTGAGGSNMGWERVRTRWYLQALSAIAVVCQAQCLRWQRLAAAPNKPNSKHAAAGLSDQVGLGGDFSRV